MGGLKVLNVNINKLKKVDKPKGAPYPGIKPNVRDIKYRGPIVDISKFMSICDKSRHTGVGL